MKKEQAKELYESVSKRLKLSFLSYYKYGFNFTGEVDDVKVYVSYGGNSDDIYRFDVDANEFQAPDTFEKLMNDYYYVAITKNGDKFEDYHY